MAKKIKKTAKKVVKKVLDKTTIDEKIIDNINENRSLYNKILCYTKCYGGYVLAISTGCIFGSSSSWELGITLLVATAGWAYWATHCNDSPKCKK
tara:strand:+ start:493 stop:777 length:285 start_codon:yes stop_codon:yes gene_type:complete